MDADKVVTATFAAAACTPITGAVVSLLHPVGDLYTSTVVSFQAQFLPAGATPPYTYAIDGGAEMTTDLTVAPTFTRTFAAPGA